MEAFWEVGESKLVNVPEFVAELSVSNDDLDIKIDGLLNHVGKQTESESVCTTLWDTVGEHLALFDDSLGDFLLLQVGVSQLLEEDLKTTAVHDFEGIDDVSLRL